MKAREKNSEKLDRKQSMEVERNQIEKMKIKDIGRQTRK